MVRHQSAKLNYAGSSPVGYSNYWSMSCNGSTLDFDSRGPSSNLGGPANIMMIYQEDLNSITIEAVDKIVCELSLYDIQLTVIQEDQLYSAIFDKIETFAEYPDYRNYN